jgi:mono/diheme cytochrome c family protein
MTKRILTFALAAAALALVLAACGSPNPQPAGLTPIPTLAAGQTPTLVVALQVGAAGAGAPAGPSDAGQGAAIYLQNCSPCHGREGEGVTAPALRNNKFITGADDKAVSDVVSAGRPGTAMPAWLQANGGRLTGGQIANVVAYLRSLQGVPEMPTATPVPAGPTDTPQPPNAPTAAPAQPSNPGEPGKAASMPGDVNRGRTAFGQYCAACHGPEGRIGAPNPGSNDGVVPSLNPIDPSIANADLKVFAANLDVFIEHGSSPSGPSALLAMPRFGENKLLTDQQIADIIAYMISLNPPQ